ncbi:helix-turn-helix transcriptional regulator [Oscillatoria laete-virens NRMC-F 0139]|nr:helix-turn-helix transcriptional regulator [Oscillatoria laete-virens NRMC-F 0139]
MKPQFKAVIPRSFQKIPPAEFKPVPLLSSFMVCYPPYRPEYFRVHGLQIFHIVEGGFRFLRADGSTQIARGGDMVVFYPGINRYEFISEQTTSFYQVQFLPAGQKETNRVPWLPGYGLIPEYLSQLRDPSRLASEMEKIIMEMDGRKPLWESRCAISLLTVMNLVFESGYEIRAPERERHGRWEKVLLKLETAPHDVSIQGLAEEEGMNPEAFIRGFKKYVGLPPKRYLLQRRMWLARRMIVYQGSIKEVAMNLGFQDPLYFSRLYRKFFGYAPSETLQHTTFPLQDGGLGLPIGRHILGQDVDISEFIVSPSARKIK